MSQPNLIHPAFKDFARFPETCDDNDQAMQIFGRLDRETQVQRERSIESYRRKHHIKVKDGLTASDFRQAIKRLKQAQI